MRTNAAKPSSSTNHRGDRRNCLKSHILAFTSIVIVTYHCLGAQLAISVHNCPVLADTRFPMSIFKRTQQKYVKKAYRVRNWREYEAGLRNRGSLTVWISLTAGKLVNWDAPRPRRRKPGRQRKYSNHAIETAVTLGMVFHLSSRQSEGLLRSLFALMKLDNDVPDHTTISRRKAKLGKVLCLLFYSSASPTGRKSALCQDRFGQALDDAR